MCPPRRCGGEKVQEHPSTRRGRADQGMVVEKEISERG